MDHRRDRRRRRIRKAKCVKKKVLRRGGRPRLAVFRSHRYIYAQVIDDVRGVTLAAASSRESAVSGAVEADSGKIGIANAVGTAIADRAKQAGVDQVVFDRRYYKYHGRVKALADAARKGGLVF